MLSETDLPHLSSHFQLWIQQDSDSNLLSCNHPSKKPNFHQIQTQRSTKLTPHQRDRSHLVVKHRWFSCRRGRDEMLVDHSHDIMTDAGKLRFDFAPVLLDPLHVMLISLRFLLLFDRREDSPRCSPRADHVLVSDREQVPLLDRQFHVQLRNFLHGIDHLCKAKHQKRKKNTLKTLKTLTVTRIGEWNR